MTTLVRMYSTAVCPFCVMAERLLRSKGVTEIEKIRIDLDPAARDDMMSRTGRRTVPQIYIGERTSAVTTTSPRSTGQGGLAPLLSAGRARLAPRLIRSAARRPRRPFAERHFRSTWPTRRHHRATGLQHPAHLPEGRFAGDPERAADLPRDRGAERRGPARRRRTRSVLDGIHEVTVTVTVTTRVKEQVAFLVEVKQAGIFEIRGLPDDADGIRARHRRPNIVYPYLRANLSDLITRTGFPPIHLTEINFEAFFNQRKAALAEAAHPVVARQRVRHADPVRRDDDDRARMVVDAIACRPAWLAASRCPAAARRLPVGRQRARGAVRRADAARHASVAIAPRGMPVEIIVAQGDWARVRDSAGGLVVDREASRWSPRAPSSRPSAGPVDVRAAPDDASPVVFRVQPGVLLDLAGPPSGGWVGVRHRDGQSGFVRVGSVWGRCPGRARRRRQRMRSAACRAPSR